MLVTVSATVSLKIAVIRTFADNKHRPGAALYDGFAAWSTHQFPGPGLRASFGWDYPCGCKPAGIFSQAAGQLGRRDFFIKLSIKLLTPCTFPVRVLVRQ